MNIVEERIKHWKQKLIDLSKRNRLLNFRPTKVTTIRVIDEIPSEVYKLIVIDNVSMGFLPVASHEKEDKEKNDTGDKKKNTEGEQKSNVSSQEFQAYESSDLEEKHIDKYLQTNLSKDDLKRNQFRIYSKATSVMEEQGYNTLFLALGYLEWYESENSDVKLKAPIILVPVELTRKSVKGYFKLEYTDEPPMFNPALIQKLKYDFGVILNIDEYFNDEINPQQILLMLQEAVKHYEQWCVTNDIYLSLFSFSKFIMYKDIEKYFSVLLESPIIKTICGQPLKQNVTLGLLEEEKDLDGILRSDNTFQILDADSSQQQAILAAKRGKDLLIEGPPGTGKSQTIANIISEFLAENKKVLFVSQKMAALEVVKKRLDNNGIGDFCLELHSRKTNKNEVIKELVRVLEIPQKPDHSHDDEIAKLEDIKKALNDYVNAIHNPYGKLEMTPYQAFGIINKHQDINDLSLVFKDVKEWSRHKYNKCCDLLDNLAFNLSKIHNPINHPWYGSQITEIYYQDKININKLLGSIIDNYSIMQSYLEKLKKSYFYYDPSTIIQIETFIDINLLFSKYHRYIKNPFLRLSISFWKDHALLKKHLNNSIYGKKVKEAFDNLKKSRSKRGDIEFDIENYKSTIRALSKVLENFKNDINKLFEILKFNDSLVFDTKFIMYKLAEFMSKIIIMKDNIDSLDYWTRYQDALQECKKEGIADFVNKVILLNFPLERIVNAFECQFLRCWLDRVFAEREPLKKFYGEDHEKLIEKFCEIDKRQIELAKIRIQHTLSGRFDCNYIPSKSSELGVILREGRKTKAHLPIRKLFELASNAIINLKPCLMMSPLTVAQFINPELIKFDLVIFDEASQIPPEDSIGPILRGKQIVIAGDSKQLPPTTFFQSEVLTPEDEDNISIETLPEDLDSILDECAVSGIPKTMLRWHYRSKHESLIAFSNKNFYNNRLFTFPYVEDECPELGIKFHYNPNTVYDRGGKGTNIEEANEVAKAVFKHFKVNPALSLGIGTFSIRQKYAIEDAIEEMLKEDSGLEAFFAKDRLEHFFIKNLETIQGDERDVIFISVGYGKDQNGRLSMNFGPINQVGGARRLNVLVTRARRRLEIFSSIRGDDFDLSKTDSDGVHLLKGYLDFAEKGKIALLRGITEKGFLESPFEESVYNLLISKGIKVQKQIGCSGYRIDLAVVDDNLPGKYILGIECDGAYYHSSSTARDRDRLRQEVLEELNWNLYRIWSTDWFNNPRKEFERLLNAIEKSKTGKFSKNKLKTNPEYKFSYKTPTDKTDTKVKDYILTPIQENSFCDDFYWADSSRIASVLKKIVEYEGPVHREEAWKRVVQHWGIRAVGSRIRQILQSAEGYCISKKMIKKKDEFYWPINMIKPSVRRRDSKEINKDIHIIDPEEIGEAALIVLKTEYSMPKDDLINQTARLLGFSKVTMDISKYIWKSLEAYKKSNNILEINEKFTFNANKEEDFKKEQFIIKEATKSHKTDSEKIFTEDRKEDIKQQLKDIEKIIEQAIENQHTITIEYISPSSGFTVRQIKPYSYDGIYIKAFCNLVHEDRTFRIDRIKTILID